jgi:hypothetical protein
VRLGPNSGKHRLWIPGDWNQERYPARAVNRVYQLFQPVAFTFFVFELYHYGCKGGITQRNEKDETSYCGRNTVFYTFGFPAGRLSPHQNDH